MEKTKIQTWTILLQTEQMMFIFYFLHKMFNISSNLNQSETFLLQTRIENRNQL